MQLLRRGLGFMTVRAASSPIETLVFCVALTFLAYLYLLHDIKHSQQSFAEPLIRLEPSTVTLERTSATELGHRILHTSSSSSACSFPENEHRKPSNSCGRSHVPDYILKQVILQDASQDDANVLDPILLRAALRLKRYLTEDVHVSDGVEKFYYKDLCLKSGDQCFVVSPFDHPTLREAEPFRKVIKAVSKQMVQVGSHATTTKSSNTLDEVLGSMPPVSLFTHPLVSDDDDHIFDSASTLILSFVLDSSTAEKEALSKAWAAKVSQTDLLDFLLSPKLDFVQSSSPNAAAAMMASTRTPTDGLVVRSKPRVVRSHAHHGRSPNVGVLEAVANSIAVMTSFVYKDDQFEALLVLASYIMMYATFMYLFATMNKLGSRVTLGCIVLVNGTMAFLVSLAITRLMGIQLSLRMLSEAIPLLVIVVGFEKPCQLTKSVLLANVNSGTSCASPSSEDIPTMYDRVRHGHISKTAKKKVTIGVRAVGERVVRHVLLEIMVLLIGAFSGVDGLQEFCVFSVLILAFDCLFMFTFYISVLALKVEIMRIRSELSRSPSEQSLANSLTHDIKMMTFRALGDSVGSEPISTQISRLNQRKQYLSGVDRSIIARLRMMVLIGFFAFHLFSLYVSPTAQVGIPKFATTQVEKVDTTVDSVERVLQCLSPLLPKDSSTSIEVAGPSFIISVGRDGIQDSRGIALLKDALHLSLYLALIVSGVINMYFMVIQRLVTEEGERLSREPSVVDGEPPSHGSRVDLMATSCPQHRPPFPRNFAALAERALPPGERPLEVMAARSLAKRDPERQQEASSSTPLPSATISRTGSSTTIASDKSNSNPINKELLKPLPPPDYEVLSDDQIVALVAGGKLPGHALEKSLKDFERAAKLRRRIVATDLGRGNDEEVATLWEGLPLSNYDYGKVYGQCCENVVGYVPIPVGLAGPYLVDGSRYYLPLATTEGCLVASTSRGCKAITLSGGATTDILSDGMSRGPIVEFDNTSDAAAFTAWVGTAAGFAQIKSWFDSTSRFARLQSLSPTTVVGRMVFVRFKTSTGDAMGMNMISKGVEKVLNELEKTAFPTMRVISISGNFCVDKKPAALNWIEGRGKSVVASCVIPSAIVHRVLKTSVAALVEVNTKKNLVGSALAGSVGGFNAHAANIVTGMYIALGQDTAQNVESSMCMTWMESVNEGRDLLLSCSMPAVEVGTVGGGTGLPAQASLLALLGVQGPNKEDPGANARQLARLVCAGVMAGELSLLSALAAGHLVKSHMQHNRAQPQSPGRQQERPTSQP